MKFLKILVGCLLILSLAACGTTTSSDSSKEKETTKEETSAKQDQVTNKEDSTNENQTTTEENSSKTEGTSDENIVKAEGTYNGQADGHSIEVETADAVMVLDTLESNVNLDQFKSGDKITFEYIANEDGQNILKSIELQK